MTCLQTDGVHELLAEHALVLQHPQLGRHVVDVPEHEDGHEGQHLVVDQVLDGGLDQVAVDAREVGDLLDMSSPVEKGQKLLCCQVPFFKMLGRVSV